MSLRRPSLPWFRWFLCMAVVLSGAIAPQRALAQLPDIRGTVIDSANRTPVTGAVVMLLDETGSMLTRTIVSERGLYRLLRLPDARRLRVVRLGFVPVTLSLDLATGRPAGGYMLDVRMAPLVRPLDEIEVTAPVARGCETRADHIRSLTLLDAARAGVLATVVASEHDPPRLTMLQFERVLEANGLDVVRQSVRVDSSPAAATSFNAVHSTADFLANGFRAGREGEYTFYSPDAQVLLDERFPRGYCFDVVSSDTAHRTHVGLHFAPAQRRRGRVDIDGTLWIDTATRALSELTFRYVGLDRLSESLGAGGHIGFRSLPSGVTFIDRWQLRLVSAPPDGGPGAPAVATYQVREVGGELAEARWADGRVWHASLATAHITAVGDGNRPAPDARLRLVGTEYRAVADARGRAIIPNLLPGPYTIAVEDPLLSTLDLTLPTRRAFVAVRSAAIVVRVELPPPISLAQTLCERTDAPRPNESWVIGRILDDAGRPVDGVRWRVYEGEDGQWKSRGDGVAGGRDGVFAFCRGVGRGRTIEVAASLRGREVLRVRRVLDAPLVAVAIRLPRPVAQQQVSTPATASSTGVLTVSGMVIDSATGRPLADARVRVVGTPFEGATDEQGRFVIGGLPAGRYVVELATATLDTFGLISQRRLEVQADPPPLVLTVPAVADARAAACRANGTPGRSLIVGRLSAPGDNLAALSGYRVVAAWDGAPFSAPTGVTPGGTASGFVRVIPDPNSGTFRICDAPVDRPLMITAEADHPGSGWAHRAVTLSAPDALARVDLVLDATATAPATWSGTVVADSGESPVSGSDVVLTNLGVTLRTNQLGQFRIHGLPTGPHLAHVRMPGFEPWAGTLEIGPGQAVEQQIVLVRTGRREEASAPVAGIRSISSGVHCPCSCSFAVH